MSDDLVNWLKGFFIGLLLMYWFSFASKNNNDTLDFEMINITHNLTGMQLVEYYDDKGCDLFIFSDINKVGCKTPKGNYLVFQDVDDREESATISINDYDDLKANKTGEPVGLQSGMVAICESPCNSV